MNLDDLASLMGKTRRQLEEDLKKNDVIELKLFERYTVKDIDTCRIEVLD